MTRQFDGEDMWSLFRDGDTRYMTHMGWGMDVPLWSAEFTIDMLSVRVHCGDVLVREEAGQTVVHSPLRYPLDQLLMTYILSRHDGAIVHAAGIECDGQLWLLAGRSGAGKSTAAALLRGWAGIELVSDDRIVVRRQSGAFTGYGTPWPGEARVAANRRAPLGGILFLEQADINAIRPLAPAEALERLLPVVSVPWYEPELFPDVLTFCGELVEQLPVNVFCFRRDAAAADVLTDFVVTYGHGTH